MLHPTKAPIVSGESSTLLTISKTKVYPDGERYSGHPGHDVLMISGNGIMLIDEDGNAKFIRQREGQAFPYDRNVYSSKRTWFIERPFEQPLSKIAEFYFNALKSI